MGYYTPYDLNLLNETNEKLISKFVKENGGY